LIKRRIGWNAHRLSSPARGIIEPRQHTQTVPPPESKKGGKGPTKGKKRGENGSGELSSSPDLKTERAKQQEIWKIGGGVRSATERTMSQVGRKVFKVVKGGPRGSRKWEKEAPSEMRGKPCKNRSTTHTSITRKRRFQADKKAWEWKKKENRGGKERGGKGKSDVFLILPKKMLQRN